MQAVGRDAVQVVARHLEDRDPLVRSDLHGFGQTLVGVGAQRHVQRRRRHSRAQAFQHRVAAQHGLGVVGLLVPALLLSRGLGGALGRRVMGPLVCGRCRTATLEPAPAHASGSDGRPLLGAGFAHRAPTLRVARHYFVYPSSSAH